MNDATRIMRLSRLLSWALARVPKHHEEDTYYVEALALVRETALLTLRALRVEHGDAALAQALAEEGVFTILTSLNAKKDTHD